MPVIDRIGRRNCVPVLYTRGTYYEVGFDVGRTFRSIINNIVEHHHALNKRYLPFYDTEEGRSQCVLTLNILKQEFPQYIKELEGMADGAQVSFLKLFLLNIEDVIAASAEIKANGGTGCSAVYCTKPGHEALGHNEDGLAEFLNHCYVLNAHIISDKPQGKWKVTEEKFGNYNYAGMLFGYTMGYNHHGLVHSANTVLTTSPGLGRIPVNFIGRSILAAKNPAEVENMLRHPGYGLASGININMTFLNQPHGVQFQYIEAGPPVNPADKESSLHVHTALPNEHLFHCNSYMKLKTPDALADETTLQSTTHRQKTISSLPPPQSAEDVLQILQDRSDAELPVFRDKDDNDRVKTMASGVFNLAEKTWSIYTDDTKTPAVILPILTKV